MTLTPTGEKPLYRVTLNGNEIESNGYSYTIPAANGDRLAIEALFPDVDCSLTFKFQNDDALDRTRPGNRDRRLRKLRAVHNR